MHNPTVLGAETPMPVLVAALGPVMLQIAGELADGTVLWMADERAIGDHIAPRITKAADNAGRPAPRIVAGIPVCLCANSEIDAAKERANRILAEAETSPNYQRLLDRGDARDVGDLRAAGDEEAILARFRRFADAGVTDLSVRLLPIGDNRDELVASKYRTREVIAELARGAMSACAKSRVHDDRPARGHPHPRGRRHAGRPVRHDAAGRPRRRGHQDRAARRRDLPPGQRQLLRQPEPQQAERLPRPAVRGGPSSGSASSSRIRMRCWSI